jgi:predicted nucleic acid-binding protein
VTYLLDTNVVSELRKSRNGKADAQVVAWADGVDAATLFLSAITILELEQGILRLARRDPAQASGLRAWLQTAILPAFGDRILPVDVSVAQRCASLHVPDPRAERDALLAATALTHGMTMVTRDVADFASTGVTVLNPWEFSTG